MFSLNASVVSALSRELDFCALRHEIYSANIANAGTEGYRRLETVRSPLATGMDASHTGAAQVVSTSDSVRLDQEMAQLTRNALRYQTLLTAYEKTAGILNLAVKEGRGG